MPLAAVLALEDVFGESVTGVRVTEHSTYARLHRGMAATTRPNRILLAGAGASFVGQPELVLHEYFHVVRQWRTGRLTRWRYVCAWGRCGYWDNPFEQEARDFAAHQLVHFQRLLASPRARHGAAPVGSAN